MHSPRPVDDDGVIYFNYNAAALRHEDSEDQQRTISPTIRQKHSSSYRQTDESRSHVPSPSFSNERESPLSPRFNPSTEDSHRALPRPSAHGNRKSLQTSQQATNRQNADVTDILYSITSVLTRMSSQLNSIKSDQANSKIHKQNTFHNDETVMTSRNQEFIRHSFSPNAQNLREVLEDQPCRSFRDPKPRQNNQNPDLGRNHPELQACDQIQVGSRSMHQQARNNNNGYEQIPNRDLYTDVQPHFDNYVQCRSRAAPAHTRFNRPRLLHDLGGFKITPFKGDGDWRVWHARFETIVSRFCLSEGEKLDQLLPRFDGKAAEFVFTQLPPIVLNNYDALINELNSRFRVIETSRSFAAKFSKRSQKIGETAEEYASELKILYDKAHGYRDAQTRNEDLVRRFLDGIRDDHIRFQVEYHKEPETIDEAVFHVVNLIQTRGRRDYDRRQSENTRRLDQEPIDGTEHNPDEQKFKSCNRVQQSSNNSLAQNTVDTSHISSVLEQIVKRLDKIENANKPGEYTQGRQPKDRRGRRECYNCHKEGHFARECPDRPTYKIRNDDARSMPEDDKKPLNWKGPALAAKGRSNN